MCPAFFLRGARRPAVRCVADRLPSRETGRDTGQRATSRSQTWEGNHRIVGITGCVSGTQGNGGQPRGSLPVNWPADEPHESCGSTRMAHQTRPGRCHGRAWEAVIGDIPPESRNDPVIGVRASARESTGVPWRSSGVVHQSQWASTGVQFCDWLQFGCKRAAGSSGRHKEKPATLRGSRVYGSEADGT